MDHNSSEYHFWYAIVGIADRLRNLSTPESLPTDFDISMRQLQVLKQIFLLTETKPEGIPLKELAQALELTPGTVSELVENLVRKEVLQRDPNPNDRRAVMIRLNDKSLMMIQEARAKAQHLVAQILEVLSPEEQAVLLAALDKLTAKIDTIEG